MNIEKGINLHINETQEKLYQIIDESKLPSSIMVLLFKDMLKQLEQVNYVNIKNEKEQYKSTLKQATEKQSQ